MVGWLALALPWLVALLLWMLPPSISATYFTYEAGPVFMIVLGSASILLFAYRGYEKIDDIINSIAAAFGLLICLFPTYNSMLDYVGTFQVPVAISSTIHNIAAFAFFGLLSFNSLFLFTKTGGEMTAEKKKRNVIYRVCGIGMLASFLLLLLPNFYFKVWLVEAIALLFFGFSWLTKADAYPWLFADKH